MRHIFLAFCWLCIMFSASGQTVWQVANSNLKFSIKNAGLTVDGTFEKMTTTIAFDANNVAQAAISGQVEVGSINTGIAMRDRHLKKSEYFHEDKFPVISLKSKSIEAKGPQQFVGQFILNIKGISKTVNIPFTFIPSGENATLSGQFTIDRRDFKVGGNSFVMSDNVKIVIELKLKKAA